MTSALILALLLGGLVAIGAGGYWHKPVVGLLGAVAIVASLLVLLGDQAQRDDECQARGGQLTRAGCVDKRVLL